MSNRLTSERPPEAAAVITAVSGALLIAYLVTTFVMFALWREFEPASTLQAWMVLLYCLATLSAVHLTSGVRTVPQLLAIPGTLLVLLLYPILASRAGLWAAIPLAMLVAVAAVLNLGAFRQVGSRRIAGTIAVGTFLAVVQFYAINGARYAFVFSDIAIVSGPTHPDTMFHSAIIGMIASQDAVSTGLHGLTPMIYHVGVHRWMAAVATMLKADIALTLAMGMQLFIVPLVLYFFLYAVQAGRLSAATPFLSVIASLAVFLFAQSNLYAGFLISESYGMSLTVMFAALPLGLRWMEPETAITRAVIPEAVMAGVLVLASGMIKYSTGYTLAAFFIASMFVLVFRHRPQLAVIVLTAMGFAGVTACLALYLFVFDPEIMPFHPGHFSSSFTARWRNSLLYGAMCIVALAVLNRAFAIPTLTRIFVVIFTLAVAIVPGELFDMGAGAYYFVHPAILIAITVTLAAMSHAIPVRFRTPEPFPFMAGMVATFALFATFRLLLPGLEQFNARIEAFHNAVAAEEKRLADTSFGGPGQSPPLRQIADRVAAIASHDERALIYVPPDNIVVWEAQRSRCWAAGFAIPTLTGLPMLAGVRGKEVGCPPRTNYGMNDYDDTAFNRPLTPDEACREARALGFEIVYSLDEGVEITRLDCTADTPQTADSAGGA